MIRDMLPDMTNEEFREVMEITTDDIRENRTKFGKETDLEEMLTIAKRSLRVLRKCNKAIEGINMDKSTERRAEKAVELYFSGYSAKEAVERAKHWKLDDTEIYDEETGITYKDIDMLTPLEMKQFLKNI